MLRNKENEMTNERGQINGEERGWADVIERRTQNDKAHQPSKSFNTMTMNTYGENIFLHFSLTDPPPFRRIEKIKISTGITTSSTARDFIGPIRMKLQRIDFINT